MSDEYIKGYIYQLSALSDINKLNVYIGSTFNIKKRFTEHRSAIKTNKTSDFRSKRSLYFKSQNDIIICEILLEYDFNNKKEMLLKESEFIDSINPVLNNNRPILTDEERIAYNNNKAKKYYEINKDRILKRMRDNYNNKKKLI